MLNSDSWDTIPEVSETNQHLAHKTPQEFRRLCMLALYEDIPTKMNDIEISKEPVELYKILKFAGLVASGGIAKALIYDGQVLVNGAVETRKGKKIVAGDTIEFESKRYKILLK